MYKLKMNELKSGITSKTEFDSFGEALVQACRISGRDLTFTADLACWTERYISDQKSYDNLPIAEIIYR